MNNFNDLLRALEPKRTGGFKQFNINSKKDLDSAIQEGRAVLQDGLLYIDGKAVYAHKHNLINAIKKLA